MSRAKDRYEQCERYSDVGSIGDRMIKEIGSFTKTFDRGKLIRFAFKIYHPYFGKTKVLRDILITSANERTYLTDSTDNSQIRVREFQTLDDAISTVSGLALEAGAQIFAALSGSTGSVFEHTNYELVGEDIVSSVPTEHYVRSELFGKRHLWIGQSDCSIRKSIYETFLPSLGCSWRERSHTFPAEPTVYDERLSLCCNYGQVAFDEDFLCELSEC